MDRSEISESWRSFLRAMLAIAVPVALQNLLSTTASMVDTVMLGTLGENTVGAVGLCAQFTSLMLSGYWGFIGGGMLFMAQFWGAKDERGICASYGMMQVCIFAVSITFCLLAVCAPDLVMRLYTDKEELWPIGISYLRVVGFAYPLQAFCVGMSAMLRTTERVRIPLAASIISLLTNLVANYVLIFGKLGFAPMGARGAAIATLCAAVVNVLAISIMAIARKHPFLLRFREHFRWNVPLLKEFLRKCFPILCNEVLIGVGNMVINVVLGRQSTQAIAALAVFRIFEGFVISFFSGFTNAASILVGKEVGAGRHELAFRRAKRLIVITPIPVFCGCLAVLAFHTPILHSLSLEGESFAVAFRLLIAFTVIAVIRMTNWIQNDLFRSAGDPVFGTVMEIVFMYALVLPAICTAGLVIRPAFLLVFLCAYIDEPIRICIMLRHTMSGRWIRPVTREGQETIGEFRARHGIAAK